MTNPITRKWTNKLIEDVQDGCFAPMTVVQMCLSYMSEADVEDMCRCNDIDLFESEYCENCGDHRETECRCGWEPGDPLEKGAY